MANTKKKQEHSDIKEALLRVKEYKTICEANIVSLLWKYPDFFHIYPDLEIDHFTENIWKVYFQIAYDLTVKENKVLDEITVNFYLEKHQKLKEKYDEYGGYSQIRDTAEYIDINNMEGYVNELNKWRTVVEMIRSKFPVFDRISEFADMSIEDIYNEYEALLNHIFVNADIKMPSYKLNEGLYELIEELDQGMAVGMAYYGLPMTTHETGGMALGHITLIGALSNVGKSTIIRSTIIPSAIKYGEKLVIMLNEDSVKKWQREMLVWIANNIFEKDLQKYTVRDGKYKPEVKELLFRCADWLKDREEAGGIYLIPFNRYSTSKVIKIINKYSSLGVNHFILDTYKADAGSVAENTWFISQQNMVDLNDTVKESNKNVHLAVTFQLAKSSSRQRYYTQDNVGVFKNIIDPVSTCIMFRNVFDDEFPGEKNAIKVYRLEGVNEKTEIPVKLDPKKRYQIGFIVKNREGAAQSYQIVYEHDLSRNKLKEIGITHIMID